MSQLFHRSANAVARASLVGGVILVVLLFGTLDRLSRSSYVTNANVARVQPVPFSHAHHVGGIGIDCRYCHTSVESASTANIPATKICMNCHSQLFTDAPTLEPVRESFRSGQSIRWTRVHDLPDFVYFDHSIHVAKGVGCETCHGRVDRMPLVSQHASLQMEWCLECHRAPERYVRPRADVFRMNYQPLGDQIELGRRLVRDYNILSPRELTSCSTCHR